MQLAKIGKPFVSITIILFGSIILIGRLHTEQVTIDYAHTLNENGDPLLFGGSNEPLPDHDTDVYPQLANTGIKFQRGTAHINEIVPANSDPSTWNWSRLSWLDYAKANSMTTMVNILECPAWLTYDSTIKGVPRDWGVWEKLIATIYAKYRSKIDYIEILNEPENMISLTNSPYKDMNAAAQDFYYHTAHAIRLVSSTVIIGGPASDRTGGDFGTIASILHDPRLGPNNLNFVSIHEYSPSPVRDAHIDELQTLLTNNGRAGLPIFLTEWNYTADMRSTDAHVYGEEAVAWSGSVLLDLMRQPGLKGAAYFSLLPGNADLDYGDCIGCISHLALYNWNPTTDTAVLLPQAYAFRVASTDLGLGKGRYMVKTATYSEGVTNALGAVNSSGELVAMIANDSAHVVTATVTLNHLPLSDNVTVTVYTASNTDDATQVLPNQSVVDGTLQLSVQLPPYSFVGLRIAPA